MLKFSAIDDNSLTLDNLQNPDTEVDKYPELLDSIAYEKLLIMYEGEKDKEQNQVQLYLGGTSVLLSAKQIYKHLQNKTTFAYHLVSLAERMEKFVDGSDI